MTSKSYTQVSTDILKADLLQVAPERFIFFCGNLISATHRQTPYHLT